MKVVRLIRRFNWLERLHETVKVAQEKPFVWGSHDCVTFSFDCITAVTGADLTPPFREKYRTVEGAHRTLRRVYKVKTLTEAMDKIFGDPIRPEEARRGDLMMINTDLGDTFGISLGKNIAFVSLKGLSQLPWTVALRAWRIG